MNNDYAYFTQEETNNRPLNLNGGVWGLQYLYCKLLFSIKQPQYDFLYTLFVDPDKFLVYNFIFYTEDDTPVSYTHLDVYKRQ